MGAGLRSVLLSALLTCGCAEDSSPIPPAGTAGTTPVVHVPPAIPPPPADGDRRPAGEVPARSRRPFDAGVSPAPAADAKGTFDLALPGPWSSTHYHLRVAADGTARLQFAGTAGREPLRVILLRVKDAPAAAERARKALGGGGTPEILDPATAGGCAGADDHREPGALPAPRARVVRVRTTTAGLALLVAAAKAAAGGTVAHDENLVPGIGPEARLDLVLAE